MTQVVSRAILQSTSVPDSLHTRIGSLAFTDGAPSNDTVKKVYDHLDFIHGVNVFLNAFAGASTYALRQGFIDAGAPDNSILLFSELMDSRSLFLTANADTVYFVGMVDLSNGPMVVETPPMALGIFDDMWWQWVIDFGPPGPDRGEGPVPAGRARLWRRSPGQWIPHRTLSHLPGVCWGARSWRTAIRDPRSRRSRTHSSCTVRPRRSRHENRHTARGRRPPGDADLATGYEVRRGQRDGVQHDSPSDFGFFELLNALVQEEPADATDPEILGQLEAIGIVKGKGFKPDKQMRRILEEATPSATRPHACSCSTPGRRRDSSTTQARRG
jgi:hypothetical protein